jgi:hypothetical protein
MAVLLGTDGAALLGLDGDVLTDGGDTLSTLQIGDTVISQYANSPVMLALINAFSLAADPSGPINAFFDNIWNINTAVGPGLDFWGKIVGIGRMLTIPPTWNFGFRQGNFKSFGFGTFYSRELSTSDFRLGDDAYRVVILAKALTNLSGCTVPEIDRVLQLLFPGRGACWVVDVGHMLSMLTFTFKLAPWEFALLTQTGVLPRGAGVGMFIQQVNPPKRFGFRQGGYQNFSKIGNFYGEPQNALN